jgi:hypothetical protein
MEAARVEQLAAMDATALVAELRALNDAGGSFDDQAQCCVHLCKSSFMPTGAAAEDAVMRGVQHAPLQMHGCGALMELLSAAPATSTSAGTDGVTSVLAAMRAHPGHARVQSAACDALSHFVALDAANCATAGAAGGLAAVVAAMTRHTADLEVALDGCTALVYLTQNHPQSAAAALDAGAVTAALAAMRAFLAIAPPVRLMGCILLTNIVRAAGTLGGAHAEGAAADAVLAAMRAHAGMPEMQRHGCNLLTQLFRDDRNADAAWVRRGGAVLTVVTAALRAHRQDMPMLSAGCASIWRLMVSTKENRRGAGVGSAIEAVVAAMRTFPAAAELQLYGCYALGSTCESVRNNQRAAAAAGALEVTISAMRAHTSFANVQFAGCFALGALVADVPSSQTRAGVLGSVEAVVALLQVCDVPLPAERVDFINKRWGLTMVQLMSGAAIGSASSSTTGSGPRTTLSRRWCARLQSSKRHWKVSCHRGVMQQQRRCCSCCPCYSGRRCKPPTPPRRPNCVWTS